MESNKLSESELFEQLEIYKDRIETITEYIEDTDDAETRSNMEVQLQRYKMTLNAIKSEIEMRKTLKKYDDKDYDLVSIFEKIKKEIIEKLNVKIPNQRYMYGDIANSRNFNQMLRNIVQSPRSYNAIGIINTEFLNQIPEEILLENKIFINKKDVIEMEGMSIFINCKSVHKLNSESCHFGNSESQHYDSCESYHLDNSISNHWNNCRSIHFDFSVSTHYDNCKSAHYDNSKQNGIKLSL
jgi:cell fate (sporulation/competence/biofilm development) regulator YlbF (YheA/YmcA/DUF963 family)